jgi:triphosphoribosyl-dephospho-CoA synthase
MEATAPKPGNVHPAAAFADLCYDDFCRSAEAIAPVMSRAREVGVGRAVLAAVHATRESVGRNTNLGIILLLAPLAAVPPDRTLEAGIADTLAGLTPDDARLVYQAIRLARPGGMGRVDEQDIASEPGVTLVEAMRLAAGRDGVAAEYATGYRLVLGFGVPVLAACRSFADAWEQAVIELHLRLMARQPDTLIARKCGSGIANESCRLAGEVLTAGWPDRAAGLKRLEHLDRWLRSDGHRRNPGTTADLVTACLFAALRDGRIAVPALEPGLRAAPALDAASGPPA